MSKASDRAYAQIRSMILSGELPAGAQLGEIQLAERCGVSRTPVREALRRLEAEAFVRRTESQRSFVADWSLNDVADAFELRGMLEAHAARLAATRLTEAAIEALRQWNGRLAQAISVHPPDIPAFLEANRQFHAIITEAAASPRLSNMLAGVTEQPVVLRTARNYDIDNLRRSWREHDELLAAFSHADSEWAHAVMIGHIRRAFHSYAEAHRNHRAQAYADAAE
ncbi:GntR family transcriptional regulator [Sphingomonas lacunae]|uniref:GntR family transcriptional regulator n=1 Tax=Sphingomonas lacunae TaxID=2698828 RepID=A0A6M4AVP7_9SPHN|nr:GntR family transcriptional regulator [Sphingomonas lacunae]QJQ31061.1 GntR family transcriptional regulator [Sphingomonas lacunae]